MLTIETIMQLLLNFPQTGREKNSQGAKCTDTKKKFNGFEILFSFKKKKISVTGLRLGDRVMLKSQILDFKNETLFVNRKLAKLK